MRLTHPRIRNASTALAIQRPENPSLPRKIRTQEEILPLSTAKPLRKDVLPSETCVPGEHPSRQDAQPPTSPSKQEGCSFGLPVAHSTTSAHQFERSRDQEIKRSRELLLASDQVRSERNASMISEGKIHYS